MRFVVRAMVRRIAPLASLLILAACSSGSGSGSSVAQTNASTNEALNSIAANTSEADGALAPPNDLNGDTYRSGATVAPSQRAARRVR